MGYYEVLVADSSFKGAGALTYRGPDTVSVGMIVKVAVKNRHVLGVVTKPVAKPAFDCKPLLISEATLPLPPELVDLATWMPSYYPASVGETLNQFLPAKLYPADNQHAAVLPPASSHNLGDSLPPLTNEQQQAVGAVNGADTFLLHGETGSGKTRVYLELARRSLNQGRSAIILTPEIGLTPQLTQAFESVFAAGRIITTHSRLTAKERSLQWNDALYSQQPLIVLGPRSALFMPLRNIGLIVLDEVHEASYKQEQAPHYHASKVAAKLAQLHDASLVLGSATPPVADYYVAMAKGKRILRMEQTARGTAQTPSAVQTCIVDLKDRSQFSKRPHISDKLIDSIGHSLKAGEQSLIFLNRRGTARTVLCEKCGWVATCSHCDLPLTYHGDNHHLRCHTCGLIQPAYISCPECSSPQIFMKSVGTKAIVEELQAAFPQASIQRFDTDNKKSERLELHYHDVRAGNVDIVVGTQVIAKGLDLPRLSTVGIIVADTSLYLPDYTAQERTYQLLRQVIGRVGRGHRDSKEPERVILQTYDPQSPVIKAAANGSWDDFYAGELEERRMYDFPPFVYTLKLSVRRASAPAAEAAGIKVAAMLRDNGLRLVVDGPMPALHEKHGDKYQWQLVCKSKDRSQLTSAIKLLPANWSYDIDPSNLL